MRGARPGVDGHATAGFPFPPAGSSSTVHAFQGRTVDSVIAAMEARHPHLTTQKSFYVEISRAHDRAELVTDDAAELRVQLQAVTGERIAALDAVDGRTAKAVAEIGDGRESGEKRSRHGIGAPDIGKAARSRVADHDLGL